MAWKRKLFGGTLAMLGFMLSPLSWWNDLFVNFPLALAFAWVIALFYKPAFGPALVVGYWLTNVLGFVLMHRGAKTLAGSQKVDYSRKELAKDLGISMLYTLLMVALIRLGVLKPIESYFP